MKKKVIIYGLGKCWDDNWEQIVQDYEVVCCSDKNKDKEQNTKGFVFCEPQQMYQYEYDRLIICLYKSRATIREELVLLYDVSPEKVYYYSELCGYSCTRPEKYCISPGKKLTVVIPTYNRRNRIARTLDLLEKQTYKDFDVIILDNASDYNISEIMQNREPEFQKRVEIRKNSSNIGMSGNLAMSFLQVEDGWIWTLSDDDIPSVYAVEMIMEEIEQNKDAGVIMFSILDMGMYMNGHRQYINSLTDLARFYEKLQEIKGLNLNGDFIFFSNKVYNISCIKKYMEEIFTYSYTRIPQIMPVLFMLNEQRKTMVISNKKIVTYSYPENGHWNWIKIALGMSTIIDLPLTYSSSEEKKVLYRLMMLREDTLLETMKEDITYENIRALERLFENIYKAYLDEEECNRYLDALSSMRKKLPDLVEA